MYDPKFTRQELNELSKIMPFYDANKAFGDFSQQYQKNHRETDAQRNEQEARILAKGQTGKNTIPLVDINEYRKSKMESDYNVRHFERKEQALRRHEKKLKLEKRNKFLKMFFQVALAVSLIGAGAYAVTHSNNASETDIGIIFNDPAGHTRFDNAKQLEDYCNANNYDISQLKYNYDSAGYVEVGNSSFVQKNDDVNMNNQEESNYGNIYNDPNGFTKFNNEQELRVYCEMNNIDFDSLIQQPDSNGKITVANTSLGLVDSNKAQRTI